MLLGHPLCGLGILYHGVSACVLIGRVVPMRQCNLRDDFHAPIAGVQHLEWAVDVSRYPIPQGPKTPFSRSMTNAALMEVSSKSRLVSALRASVGNGALMACS